MGFGKELLCQAHPKVNPLPFSKAFPGGRAKNIPNTSQSPQRDSKPGEIWCSPIPDGFAPWKAPNPTGCMSGMALERMEILISSRFSPPGGSSIPGSLFRLSPNSLCPPGFAPALSIVFQGIQGKVPLDKNRELAPWDLLWEAEFLLGRKAGGDFQGNLHLETPTFGQQIFLESGVWVWKS